MVFFNEQFKASRATIEEFWAFERNCVNMSHDEFVELMKERVKFMTPMQLEGAMICIRKELTDVHIPNDRYLMLDRQILPLLEDALEHPFNPQLSLF